MRRIFFVLAAVFLALPARADDAAPVARMVTSLGTITIALDRTHAPLTVENFIRYAREGHFDGTIVYRVVPGFVIQAGSIDAAGKERPGHDPIPLESGNGLHNVRGAIAMARSEQPVSATADFFINLVDNARLDPKPTEAPGTTGYAVFGQVTEGMDVVDKIAAVPLGNGKGPFPDNEPVAPVVIEKVTIE